MDEVIEMEVRRREENSGCCVALYIIYQGAVAESGKTRCGKAGRAVFHVVESISMGWSRSMSTQRYDLRLC
jgi:hypothetical protein